MYKIGIECGQHLFSPYSWRRTKCCDNVFRFRRLRLNKGFAFGPVMVYKKFSQ